MASPEGRWAGRGQGTFVFGGITLNSDEPQLGNAMKMWKGNGNTTTLLFYLKELDILYEWREQVTTVVMEHFNSILFCKSGPADKQHIYYYMYMDAAPNLYFKI